ncbi:LPD29 domain-containing protein [Nocardia sp. CA-128927]|uniref:LPD29 domain-containing protein n=1 Tax=Nocardia sp. CA-128927 TaxID=3239975 RepID=UPI003D95CC1B
MPQMIVDDRYRILDLDRRTVVRDGLCAQDALDALDDLLTQQEQANHPVMVNRFWDRALVHSPATASGFRTRYRIIATNTIDFRARVHLLRASLRKRWPAAAFTVMPRSSGSVSIRWIDGPDYPAVDHYCDKIDGGVYEHSPITEVEFNRILTLRGWHAVAELVASSLQIRVPRTSDDDIDWTAADSLNIDGPAPVAGHCVCTAAKVLSISLGELLRHLADVCDLTNLDHSIATPQKDTPHGD